MADEKTPLLCKADVSHGIQDPAYPEGMKYHGFDLFAPFKLAFRWYWAVIILAFASAMTNFILTIKHDVVVVLHPLVFKSLLVVFGFVLGFRNVSANKRVEEAAYKIQELFSTAWTILMLVPNESRPRVSKAMVLALQELAVHIMSVSRRKYWWHAMTELRPDEKTHMGFVGDSGRTFLMHVLLVAEDQLRPNKSKSNTEKIRILWPAKVKLMDIVDDITHLSIPAVTDRYAAFVDCCLIAFVVMFPWGLDPTSMESAVMNGGGSKAMVLCAGLMSGFEALFVAIVLLGLNALAQENEDPFGYYYEDYDLKAFVRIFEQKLAHYEHQHTQVEQVMKGQAPDGATENEMEVWYHALMCGRLAADEKGLGDKMKKQLDLV